MQVYNHINHAELKNYKYPECMGKAHEGDVRALVFVDQHNLLISASSDRSIAIHDDSKVPSVSHDCRFRAAVKTLHISDRQSFPTPGPL